MMDDVKEYLKSLNIGNDIIVAGISSGPDSMCLLSILLEMKLNIVVAHVNHNVRKQSIKEEEYLREFCKNEGIKFECYKIENYHGTNFHMDARNIRYDFYYNLIDKYKAKYLMTAHHGDDLMETILMRLSRGTSFIGYSGFTRIKKENDYYLVRPLITKTKKELLNYVAANNIKYYIDETNTSDEYTRNRYRKYILPKLKEEDSNVHLKYLKFSNVINEYNNFVNNCVLKVIFKIYKDNILYIDEYNKEENLIKIRIIEYILSKLYDNDIYLLNDKHIKAIQDLIENNKANSSILLPKNLKVIKSYDKLLFEFDLNYSKSFNYILNESQLLNNGYTISVVPSSDDPGNNTIRLLSTDIKLPIHIRSRLDGDKMIVKNMIGHKKINDIFIDSKIDKMKRDNYPVVTDDNDLVIWLPGLKKSNLDRSINDKYDLILNYKKEGK